MINLNELVNQRTDKTLKSEQRHPMEIRYQTNGGDLYFKSVKDTCMSSGKPSQSSYKGEQLLAL